MKGSEKNEKKSGEGHHTLQAHGLSNGWRGESTVFATFSPFKKEDFHLFRMKLAQKQRVNNKGRDALPHCGKKQ